jgi:hypothetical protein
MAGDVALPPGTGGEIADRGRFPCTAMTGGPATIIASASGCALPPAPQPRRATAIAGMPAEPPAVSGPSPAKAAAGSPGRLIWHADKGVQANHLPPKPIAPRQRPTRRWHAGPGCGTLG